MDWGLTYHSKVDYTLEGDTTVSGGTGALGPIPGMTPGLNGEYDAKLDITMPESVDTSFSYQATDELALYAGATWTRWSRLEGIEVENSGVFPLYSAQFDTVSEELNWEDTWSFAVGGAYQLNPKWVIRAGYALSLIHI